MTCWLLYDLSPFLMDRRFANRLSISNCQDFHLNYNDDLVSRTQYLRMSLPNPAQSLPAICTFNLNSNASEQTVVKAPREGYLDRSNTVLRLHRSSTDSSRRGICKPHIERQNSLRKRHPECGLPLLIKGHEDYQ